MFKKSAPSIICFLTNPAVSFSYGIVNQNAYISIISSVIKGLDFHDTYLSFTVMVLPLVHTAVSLALSLQQTWHSCLLTSCSGKSVSRKLQKTFLTSPETL